MFPVSSSSSVVYIILVHDLLPNDTLYVTELTEDKAVMDNVSYNVSDNLSCNVTQTTTLYKHQRVTRDEEKLCNHGEYETEVWKLIGDLQV